MGDYYLGGEAVDLEADVGDGLGGFLHFFRLAHLEQALGLRRGVFKQQHLRLVLHAGDVQECRRVPLLVLVHQLHVERVETSLRRENLLQLSCAANHITGKILSSNSSNTLPTNRTRITNMEFLPKVAWELM